MARARLMKGTVSNLMKKDQKDQVDLLTINLDVFGKCNFRCEDCYRFFQCNLPQRNEFYRSRRIEAIAENLSDVKHIIPIMSGKGGVGKSIISANLAVGLANRGYAVAVVDSDLYGPSIPCILGIENKKLAFGSKGMIPPQASLGVKVMSMEFLLDDEEPVTWLSDLKRSAQERFLANTHYGALDYLIIDMPPGTGSETVNLLKLLPQLSGVVVITVPSSITEQVVRRCIALCQKAGIPILGLIENMSELICPNCGEIYTSEQCSSDVLSFEVGVPLLGRIARDRLIVEAADQGLPFVTKYPGSKASKNFNSIVNKIEKVMGSKRGAFETPQKEEGQSRVLAINYDPSCKGKICFKCADYFQCTLSKKEDFRELSIYKNIRTAMAGVRHKIAIMSCKGGVGKSTLTANLAVALAQKGKEIVILDCDFHGPCIPKILGVEAKGMKYGKKGIVPLFGTPNVRVVSMDFLLEQNEAVTWFDPLKKMTVAQFLYGVDYGNPDYLLIDLPPGTGAESYGILQYVPDMDGAVIITLPSESPQVVTRRSIGLCRQANVPVIGIVENMSYFLCSNCDCISKMFGTKETEDLTSIVGVPFLGGIPLESNIFLSSDEGEPFVTSFPNSVASCSVRDIAERIEKAVEIKSRQEWESQ